MIDMEIVESTPLPRLLDSAPYNQLSLSCAAMMRVRVSPVVFNVTFSWWQSMVGGPLQAVPPEEFTNSSYGSTVTSQLSVNVSAAGTHTYRCRVSLDLRPAPDNKSKEIERNITVYGEYGGRGYSNGWGYSNGKGYSSGRAAAMGGATAMGRATAVGGLQE